MTRDVKMLLNIFVSILLAFGVSGEPVQLVPKMVRWPTHLDHYLCKQLHTGIGVRSYAITNLSGELCKTYCRLIDRINGKITYTENVSPNFVRCGPFQARCVEGQCIGLNFPGSNVGQGGPAALPAAPPTPAATDGLDLMVDSAEVFNNSTGTDKPAEDGEDANN